MGNRKRKQKQINKKPERKANRSGTLADGDILLFRKRGLISRYGRGQYSHAAMLINIRYQWFLIEQRELKGGRIVSLESEIAKHPHGIDVYQYRYFDLPLSKDVHAATWRDNATKNMLDVVGRPYGYWSILLCVLLHVPGLNRIIKGVSDDQSLVRKQHCSQAVSAAYRAAGIDLVPNLADWATEPNDLARSASLSFSHRLTPRGR